MTSLRVNTWDPGGGFFGPLGVKLYFGFTRSWSLSCSNVAGFFYKLQILASYNNLRIGQDSEFAQFSPRALLMSKLAKLLPLQ